MKMTQNNKYQAPEIEFVKLQTMDILTVSSGGFEGDLDPLKLEEP